MVVRGRRLERFDDAMVILVDTLVLASAAILILGMDEVPQQKEKGLDTRVLKSETPMENL